MHSVRIPLRRGVLVTTLCDKVCQWLAAGRWFSPGTPVSPPIKLTATEILLKGASNTKLGNVSMTTKHTMDRSALSKHVLICIQPFFRFSENYLLKTWSMVCLVVIETFPFELISGGRFFCWTLQICCWLMCTSNYSLIY